MLLRGSSAANHQIKRDFFLCSLGEDPVPPAAYPGSEEDSGDSPEEVCSQEPSLPRRRRRRRRELLADSAAEVQTCHLLSSSEATTFDL